MSKYTNSNKLPGKAKYSGRRRTTTRKSGFKSHESSTGGELRVENIPQISLKSGVTYKLDCTIPKHKLGSFIGFGGWFCSIEPIEVEFSSNVKRYTLTNYQYPNWNKFGSIWLSDDGKQETIEITLKSNKNTKIAFYGLNAGVIANGHYGNARPAVLINMYQFAPEGLFFKDKPNSNVVVPKEFRQSLDKTDSIKIYLKSCNRCARFLPINIEKERDHLSFSNHCVAEHRRPCSHKGFGRLTNVETKSTVNLEYGYQLECRFCKKFEVNAALNPLRTAAQMKEDGARRRHFELLLERLYKGSPQIKYKEKFKSELADDIYKKFGGKCFKCGTKIQNAKKMHLDHTRPLALLWQLDETATCLCGNCNSSKRDRFPTDFYTAKELKKLSTITKIPIEELSNPSPNMKAIDFIVKNLDWFFNDFLKSKEMTKVRDGKLTGELLIKALQKVLNSCKDGAPIDLMKEYEKRLK